MSGEGFVSRWSRRKAAGRAPAPETPEAQPALAETPGEPEPAADPAPALPDEEIAALPDPATLTAEADVAPFLRPGVPVALKTAALRRIWTLNATIATYVDPAMEYAWDWNVPGGVPGAGALTAADDAANAVARLFEGTPRRAAELRSAPDTTPSSPPSLEAEPDQPSPEAPETPALASDEAADAPPAPPRDDSPRPRRRHGGAVPI